MYQKRGLGEGLGSWLACWMVYYTILHVSNDGDKSWTRAVREGGEKGGEGR